MPPLQAIFRGFLLTSLARYMSPPWAVATSSLLFAMCHFRLQVRRVRSVAWRCSCHRPGRNTGLQCCERAALRGRAVALRRAAQTFLPLLVLGVVFSVVYLSTRNLLPPMVLHSAWNVFVLANLLLKTGGAV